MLTGIIMAGGLSKRFKQDKAVYGRLEEQQFWSALAITKMDKVCGGNFYLAGNQANQEILQKRHPQWAKQIITDTPPFIGCGPLSALWTAAEKIDGPIEVLTMAIDYPTISERTLRLLAKEPNCYGIDEHQQAHYTLAHLAFTKSQLEESLEDQEYQLKRFLEKIGARPILLPSDELLNQNFPKH